MPMSVCRICGKKIPNSYRQWHERNQCVKARIERGEYVDPKVRAKAEKERIQKQIADAEAIKNAPLFQFCNSEIKK